MKYIIDVSEDLVTCGAELYTEKGTVTGLKLTPYNESEVEQRGIDKAWGLAQKLENMEIDDWRDCFHSSYVEDGISKMSFNEANEKYRAWQKEQGEIHVGDEVEHTNGKKGIVFNVGVPSIVNQEIVICTIWYMDENDFIKWPVNEIKKTGRKFSEVGEFFENLMGNV